MAATIARAVGFNKRGSQQAGQTSRLGHGSAKAEASTWRTFFTAFVRADGSGYVEVRRDGVLVHNFEIDEEEGN